MAKKRRTVSRAKKGIFAGLQKPLTGGIAYAVVEPLFDMALARIGIGGVPREFAQMGGAILVHHFMPNTLTKSIRDGAIYVNVYQLSRGLTGNLFGALTGGTSGPQGVTVYG